MTISEDTLQFKPLREESAEEIIVRVYEALKAKGYDPVSQLVGYLTSGDPTYITSYQGARSLICHRNVDDILEEMVSFYLSRHEA